MSETLIGALVAILSRLDGFQLLGVLLAAWWALREAGLWFLRFLPRDSQRLYSIDQKRAILRRAGYRCEHRWVVLFRCRKRNRLQADHIHPWSRGGRTSVANGSALCPRHNRQKSNHVPSIFYRWSIGLSRRGNGRVYRRGA